MEVLGFQIPYHPWLYFLLSLSLLWFSLSLPFYRTSTPWNFTKIESLFQEDLLLAFLWPILRTLINLYLYPSFHHLPPPHGPKPQSMDG